MRRPGMSQGILSSLPLQMLLFFDGWYSALYFIIELCLYIYKATVYYYPSSAIGLEVSMVIIYGVLQYTRVFMGGKGNKTETLEPLAAAGVLTAPVLLLYVYALALQTYVLRLDVVLASIGLVFVGLESLLMVTAAIAFYNAFRG